MNTKTNTAEWLVVRKDALPDIFTAVLQMKQELLQNPAASVSETARRHGISRSAYYKYREAVRPYIGRDAAAKMTVRVMLQDSPGVLSALLSAFAKAGANVQTVDQQTPENGLATVTISVRADRMSLPPDLFAEQLSHVPGVQQILDIQQEGGNNG
ncbi:MAG: ACT domain-containing protein [Clostridia bacterium]|nr:ACT domain-containing protein [Clostridia bacterium]